jgi:hypothetical protein
VLVGVDECSHRQNGVLADPHSSDPGIRRFERRWQVPGLRLMSTGILAVNSGFALGKRIHDRKNARFVVATMPSRSISK